MSRLPAPVAVSVQRSILFAVVTALLAASSAVAQAPKGFYGGGGLGWGYVSSADESDDYYYIPTYDTGEEDTALELHFGYRLGEHFATELGYVQTSPGWEDSFVFVPELNDFYNTFVDLDVDAAQASIIGILPFARIWEFYGKGGVVFWQSTADQTLVRTSDGARLTRATDDTGSSLLFAMGIGASVKPAWHLRFEFQSFSIDRDLIVAPGDTSIDSMLLTVSFRPTARAGASGTNGN